MCFSPNSKLLACGYKLHQERRWHSEVWIWDIKKGDLKQSFEGHSNPTFLPEGELVTSTTGKDQFKQEGRKTKTLKLWNVESGEFIRTLGEHDFNVSAIACGPDGKTLASASYGEVKFWDVKAGKLLRTIDGRFGDIRSIAYSPDGSKVAISNEHRMLWLLDIRKKHAIRQLKQLGDGGPMVFSPDGSTLIVGGCAVELLMPSGPRIRVFFQVLPRFSDKATTTWVSYTPEGYYNCSDGAKDLIGWRDGDRIVDINVYEKIYYRPDLVRKACQANNNGAKY